MRALVPCRARGLALPALLATSLLTSSLLAGCGAKKEAAPVIGTVVVDRRTIVVDAQATGAVEPINVIEVKSKASGQITRMRVLSARARVSKSRPCRDRPCTQTTTCGWAGLPVAFHSQQAMRCRPSGAGARPGCTGAAALPGHST